MEGDQNRLRKQSNQLPDDNGVKAEVFATTDDSALTRPVETEVFSGELDPGHIFYACPMTQEGRALLENNDKNFVATIDGGGSTDPVSCSDGQNNDHESPTLPLVEDDTVAARKFGERL